MASRLTLLCGSLAVAGALGLGAAAAQSSASSPPHLDTLQSGLSDRLQEAAQNLRPDGDRFKATRALDAARRLARVENSLVGCPQATSPVPLKAVESARLALQNGRADDAAKVLSEASLASSRPGPTPCPSAASAVGKLVMNARGERIGRLSALAPGGDAVLKVGGAINWFGFLDFGNGRRTVPAKRLVEGRRMVVLLDS